MTGKGQFVIKGNRIYWSDILRTFMIFLVVLYHAGLVYEYTGIAAFFWTVHDPLWFNFHLSLLCSLYVMINTFRYVIFI